jgi:hypothetical protein
MHEKEISHRVHREHRGEENWLRSTEELTRTEARFDSMDFCTSFLWYSDSVYSVISVLNLLPLSLTLSPENAAGICDSEGVTYRSRE